MTDRLSVRCKLSEKGKQVLGRLHRRHKDRLGTILPNPPGQKGRQLAAMGRGFIAVRWDGNAPETVNIYAREFIEIIDPAPNKG